MTNEEALKIINKNLSVAIHDWDDPTDEYQQEQAEAFQKAKEALEKQIPRKPERIDKNETFDGNWTKVCPICGKVLVERITTKDLSISHCYWYSLHCKCGQRLDWRTSDAKEVH